MCVLCACYARDMCVLCAGHVRAMCGLCACYVCAMCVICACYVRAVCVLCACFTATPSSVTNKNPGSDHAVRICFYINEDHAVRYTLRCHIDMGRVAHNAPLEWIYDKQTKVTTMICH